MAKAIGTLGTIDTIEVGGRVYTDLTNLFYLGGGIATANRFATLRTMNGSAGYQVTAAKTLTIYSVLINRVAATTLGTAAILYGDTDVGFDAAAAPTTPIYQCGNSAAMVVSYLNSSTSLGPISSPINFQVPATKYPAVSLSSANSSCVAYGYEV